MQCPSCQQLGRKFGKDRYGRQRFQCIPCKKTYSDRPAKPLDEMRLEMDKAVLVLKHLCEGCSIRSTVRLTGVAKATVLALLATVGDKCRWFLKENIKGVEPTNVQVDEVWGFVGMKQKTKNKKEINDEELGDAYCYVAIDRDTKLVLTWHLDKRSATGALIIMEKLNDATKGSFQLTTDGFQAYPGAVDVCLDRPVDYAQLIKNYAETTDQHRYSPAKVTGTTRVICCGQPNYEGICTSHIERQNLTIRMQTRRMTRLTNAFSKKWDNHRASLALFFAFYDYCRPHQTLTKAAEGVKTTPAMAAGLTDHVWSLEELVLASTQF